MALDHRLQRDRTGQLTLPAEPVKDRTRENSVTPGPSGQGRAARVLIIVPVLRRPQNVQPLLRSVQQTTPPGIYNVLFVCDRGDNDEIDTVVAATKKRPWVSWTALPAGSNYAKKINHGVRLWPGFPLYFFGADDLRFRTGWLTAAAAKMEEEQAGVVGTNDLCNPRTMAGEHATHFLVRGDYAHEPLIDGEPGPLCELYPHEYVDDEFIGTAKKRGKYAMALDSEVKHLHPLNGTAETDELYAAIPERMAAGLPIHESRRHLWLKD